MTLQEAETKLSQIDAKIAEFITGREHVLKEWNAAFNTENQENIICVDEGIGDCHIIYLINGDSKRKVCRFGDWELKHGVKDFYRMIDNMIKMTNIANGREYYERKRMDCFIK